MLVTRATLKKGLVAAAISSAFCLIIGYLFHGELLRSDIASAIGIGLANFLLRFAEIKSKS